MATLPVSFENPLKSYHLRIPSPVYKITLTVTGILLMLSSFALLGSMYQPLSSFTQLMAFMGTQGQIATAALSGTFFILTAIAYLKKCHHEHLANVTMRQQLQDLINDNAATQKKITQLQPKIENLFLKQELQEACFVEIQKQVDLKQRVLELSQNCIETRQKTAEVRQDKFELILDNRIDVQKLIASFETTTNHLNDRLTIFESTIQKINDQEKVHFKNTISTLKAEINFLNLQFQKLKTLSRFDKTAETSPIKQLSDELLVMIFNNLTIPDFNNCALVNKHWKSVIDEGSLWKKYDVSSSPSKIEENLSAKQQYGDLNQCRTLQKSYLNDFKVHALPGQYQFFKTYGNKLLTLNLDDVAEIWDLQTLNKITEIPFNFQKKITAACTSEEGLFAVGIGSSPATVQIYDLKNSKLLAEFQEENSKIKKLYINQNRLFAACTKKTTGFFDYSISVWDLNTFKEIHRFSYRQNEGLDVIFMHVHDTILIAGTQRFIRICDLDKNALICELHCPYGLFDHSTMGDFIVETSVENNLSDGYRPWIDARLQGDYLYTYDSFQKMRWDLKAIKEQFNGKRLQIRCDDSLCKIYLEIENLYAQNNNSLKNEDFISQYSGYESLFTFKFYDRTQLSYFPFKINFIKCLLTPHSVIDIKGNLILVNNNMSLTLNDTSYIKPKRTFTLKELGLSDIDKITDAILGANSMIYHTPDYSIRVLKFSEEPK